MGDGLGGSEPGRLTFHVTIVADSADGRTVPLADDTRLVGKRALIVDDNAPIAGSSLHTAKWGMFSRDRLTGGSAQVDPAAIRTTSP
jgi:hypothetical protein